MKQDANSIRLEIKEMLQAIVEGQQVLLKEVRELREEQKKLEEDIRINNFVLNSLAIRREIAN